MSYMFDNCRKLTTIYVSDKWSTESVTSSGNMFNNCTNLVGSMGTVYDSAHINAEYAHIDGGTSNPGYLSYGGPAAIIYSDGTMVFQAHSGVDLSHGTVVASYPGIDGGNGWLEATYADKSEVPWYSNRNAFTSVVVANSLKPVSTAYWFNGCGKCGTMDLTKLDVSSVTDMSYMFNNAGANAKDIININLSNWDVSKVTNMDFMFSSVGSYYATTLNIEGLSTWNVASVTSMQYMFDGAGRKATTWNIGDLSGWNVSSVKNMSYAFDNAGYNATTWSIGDLCNWDVSSVEDMSYAFSYTGYSATTWSIGDLSGWDVSSVTNMSGMFSAAGNKATTWSVGNLNNWDVSSVTNMSGMFSSAGCNATTLSIDLGKWDVSSVQNMARMFSGTGSNATTCNISGLNNWDVSSVTNMSRMFSYTGCNATTFNIGDISAWDVSSVQKMANMFSGYNTQTLILDLSGWDTSSVQRTEYMFSDCSNLTTIFVSDRWSMESVTYSENMFIGCTSLVGGMGTTYDANNIEVEYAHIDGGWDNPGYLTQIGPIAIVYSDGTLVFQNDIEIDSTHGTVIATYQGINGWLDNEGGYEDETYVPWYSHASDITSVIVADRIKPVSTAHWFADTDNCEYMDLSNLDTSAVTTMNSMFCYSGYNASTVEIVGLDRWDVSSVTDMSWMFAYAGACAYTFDIGDISNWDVSSVTDMRYMFCCALAYHDEAEAFDIGNLNNWDVSSVTNMASMFESAGEMSMGWNIGDLSNWDVSSVTDMSYMFAYAGGYDETFDIGNLNNWDVSSVTDMSYMFAYAGGCDETFDIGDLSGWDVSSATNMSSMFSYAGSDATTWSVGDLSGWDVSSVTNMNSMFRNICYSSGIWSLGDLSQWDVSSVTDMGYMFSYAGYNAAFFTLDLSGWDTSNVKNMTQMFAYCPQLTTIYVSDEWSTASVTSSTNMFKGCTNLVGGAGTKYNASYVTATRAHIDDLSNPGYLTRIGPVAIVYSDGAMVFQNDIEVDPAHGIVVAAYHGIGGWLDVEYEYCDTPWYDNVNEISNVIIADTIQPISTAYWFADASCHTFDLAKLDTSAVTNMEAMFMQTNSCTSTLRITGLGNWDVSQVENMSYMFGRCGDFTDVVAIEGLGNWDVSSVENMSSMFNESGYYATTWDIGDIGGWDVSSVADMRYMFDSSGLSGTLDLSGWDTSKVEKMNYMFGYCPNLTTIYVSNLWSTASVTSSVGMFIGCDSLVGGMGTVYDSSHIDAGYAHIDGGAANPGYLTSTSHTHSYTSQVTKAATCTATGTTTHTCWCGHSYTTSIAKTEHTSVNGGTASVHTKCSACGTTLSSTHSYTSKVTKAATCTAAGNKRYTCACGYYYDESIAATGHSSTYGGTASVHTKCSTCGATLSSTHSYTSKVTKAATCTTAGNRRYTCACGYYYDESIAATGHSSTYGGTASVHTKCSTCGTTLSSGHSYSYATVTAATCTAAGTGKASCACGYYYTYDIAALGHNPGAAATCTTAQTCTRCGTQLAAALGHNFVWYYTNYGGACSWPSSEKYKCSRCSATEDRTGSYNYSYHNYTNWKIYNDIQHRGTCSWCGGYGYGYCYDDTNDNYCDVCGGWFVE